MMRLVVRYSKRQQACVPCAPSGLGTRTPSKRQYGRKPGTHTHRRTFMCQVRRANAVRWCRYGSVDLSLMARGYLAAGNDLKRSLDSHYTADHRSAGSFKRSSFSPSILLRFQWPYSNAVVVIQSVNINATEYLFAAAVTAAVSRTIRKAGRRSVRHSSFFGSYCNFSIA